MSPARNTVCSIRLAPTANSQAAGTTEIIVLDSCRATRRGQIARTPGIFNRPVDGPLGPTLVGLLAVR